MFFTDRSEEYPPDGILQCFSNAWKIAQPHSAYLRTQWPAPQPCQYKCNLPHNPMTKHKGKKSDALRIAC
jgi:hypothetical protein